MSAFGMVGKLATDAKDRDTLIDILTQAADLMQDADGCNLYVVSKDADDDGAVWVMELWDTKEAHDLSLTMDGVRELIGKAMPLLKGDQSSVNLVPVSGKGL
jgi:quinol monooxygenase YgiN